MKSKKKLLPITLLMVVTLSALSLTGCDTTKTDDEISSTHVADTNEEIKSIHVKANYDNIIFATSDNLEVTVTLDNQEMVLDTIVDGVVNISGSEVKPGVNLEGSKTMYIYLPDKQYEQITANTIVGDIEIKNVDTKDILIESNHGKVVISGMSGVIDATAALGQIEVPDDAGITINRKMFGISNEASGQFGSDTEKNIEIDTITGEIVFEQG